MQLEKHDGERSVKFAGVKIELGGRNFIVPPLSLGDIELHKDAIARLRKMEGDDKLLLISEATPVIHAALARNYPDLTVQEVGGLVDILSFDTVIREVWGLSGLIARKVEVPGEANPVPMTPNA